MKRSLLAAILFGWTAVAAAEQAPLNVQVFTSSPEGFAVNATLVSGQKDAILIDSQFLVKDATQLAASIKATGKNLTTVYITHWHPDHYFGLASLKQAFPKAKFIAQPATVALIQKSWKQKVDQWKPSYGENIPDHPVLPKAFKGDSLTLEGQTLKIYSGQGDSNDNSFVFIPTLKTVICGDIVYHGVYPWTVETTVADRKNWRRTLDQIAELNPVVVVAGHKNPALPNDPSSLTLMQDYLNVYDAALVQSKSSEDLQAKVKLKYPSWMLDVILKIAADAAFKSTSH